MRQEKEITIIGGGLAGSEATWQLAKRGVAVTLLEMRPEVKTPAHQTGLMGELVCSNSLGADDFSSAAGILKAELRCLDSLIMDAADHSVVPAGKALAVDRKEFASYITEKISSHPLVRIERKEVIAIPDGMSIIATGPLTSPTLARKIQQLSGQENLSFFDAVAPVVFHDSIDMDRAYRAGRYGQRADYINCPMNKEEYVTFVEALTTAERAPRHDFEKDVHYFEGCLPVEVIASRGIDTLRFGPLRPVGLPDPSSGCEPYAVVQLRQDNAEGSLYNLVGFQTSLKWGEQDRVFRLIPALERAEFARYGVMHRNIYVNAPKVLDRYLRFQKHETLFLAGQITGVEGYLESTAMGLVAGLNMASLVKGKDLPSWPAETGIGSLLRYLQETDPEVFHPMNVNLGIFPPLGEKIRKRAERCKKVGLRSMKALDFFLKSLPQ
ncbi:MULTISPECIES: methylenetetrahydrofolate--tRNA-(uracil(54)-C(5))-methyltransferase (FADH(2)-oxidizing) TrmFO [Aminobacterium]|jgi:methylenetetrahydrofolate--tRNA-(uracil-5-)-methyltransferase|uniref:methylenetetrahydrofolate--tRNA-(uracil(54)- C(5))-methyltransferase (FADH(2)-oxidizing) TrmFO n=1 Tax=Aminobacterium TaxID=81466 RepID=UPI00257B6C78|nr:methylenetetrahydrofolate--tRNA-(uracil(54)-C(5))-methyltransferase (FADH(2)-oxidizing) TrmFO [Aminobacterium sp. UBA4834]